MWHRETGFVVLLPGLMSLVLAGSFLANAAEAKADHDRVTTITWSPTLPEIGELIQLQINGHAGDIRAEWDFGENGCTSYSRIQVCSPTFSNCHDMGFKFASAGQKTVSVTVKDPTSGAVLGTDTANITVENVGSCDGSGSPGEFVILSSAYANGAEGSIFRHEMELSNPAKMQASILIDWLPRGSDNSVPPFSRVYVVPGQSSVRVSNALEEFFGLEPDQVGSLRITPLSGVVELSNLLLNSSDDGDLGYVIPGGYQEDGLAQSEEGFVINLSENDDLRSNLLCVNMANDSVSIVIELFDDSGVLLETKNMDLGPWSNNQINRVFHSYAPTDGFLRVHSSVPGSRFICAGMVVTNLANDPRAEPLLIPVDFGETYYLPRAIHEGTKTTDLVLFAPTGDAVVRIALLPTGQDNTAYIAANLAVPGGEKIRLPSVLDTVFSFQGTAALRLDPISGVMVASASESITPPGLGRLARVRPIGEQTSWNSQAAIVHLTESADRRTDIGIANTSDVTIDVTIDLRDNLDSRLGTHHLHVLPYSHLQIDSVFSLLGHSDVPDGMARLMTLTPGGSFLAYAIVTELNTLDSWEMTSFPLSDSLFADAFESGNTSAWTATLP